MQFAIRPRPKFLMEPVDRVGVPQQPEPLADAERVRALAQKLLAALHLGGIGLVIAIRFALPDERQVNGLHVGTDERLHPCRRSYGVVIALRVESLKFRWRLDFLRREKKPGAAQRQ